MSAQKLNHRARHGCDVDIPEGARRHYSIRCPKCDGEGGDCELCGHDELPGFLLMRRCPASHMSHDIGEALTALHWLKDGVLPEGGCLGDQSISFVEFRKLFESEMNEAVSEQRKEG
tara:strand:+ start:39494 stop:39844 length:351 start_codon:yes stop_codon:yes gene_type:complete